MSGNVALATGSVIVIPGNSVRKASPMSQRIVELLCKYGEKKFRDEWWPGNAEPHIGAAGTELEKLLESGYEGKVDRVVELLNDYGAAKFGDDWCPGDAQPWIGKGPGSELEIMLGVTDLASAREAAAQEAFEEHDLGGYDFIEVTEDWESEGPDGLQISFLVSDPDDDEASLSGFLSVEFAPGSAEIVGIVAGVDGEVLTPDTAPAI